MNETPEFLVPGRKMVIGSYTFSEQEIVDFCRTFDPERLAAEPIQATHWHVTSIWMRLQRSHVARQIEAIKKAGTTIPQFGPSPGMTEMIWPEDVLPGDEITYTNEILAARTSNSRPEWNVLTQKSIGENQRNELVMSFISSVFIKW